MTENTHPITPPPELVQQWLNLWSELPITRPHFNEWLSTQAARWGADQELEACSELASKFNYDDYRYQDELRYLRRHKQPCLKEQGLKALDSFEGFTGSLEEVDIIRRALEALPDV